MGVAFALACAFVWALSTLIVRTQTYHLRPLTLNIARINISGLLFVPILLSYSWAEYQALPLRAYGMVCGALAFGLLFGDTLFIRSVAMLGAARSLPLLNLFPVFTLITSPVMTGEKPTLHMALGTLLVVAGVTCIARSGAQAVPGSATPRLGKGVAVLAVGLAIIANVSWAIGTCINRLVFMEFDANVMMIAAVRMTVLAVVSWTLLPFKGRVAELRGLKRRNWVALAATGVAGTFLGGIFYMTSLKYIDAARAAALTTTAPLFGVPLAVWLLEERINRWTVFGMALALLGAWSVSAPPEWQFL